MSSSDTGPGGRKRERIVAGFLVASAAASVGFIVAYVADASIQIEGSLVWFSLALLAAAFITWERWFMHHPEQVEERHEMISSYETRIEAADAYQEGQDALIGRRNWLFRMLAGAAGVFGFALLVPLRSLSLDDIKKVGRTPWRRGLRLVRADGKPVNVADLDVGSVVTVFPEGFVGPDKIHEMANAATMLVRVVPSELDLPANRTGWAPQGYVAYSKVCTHAGCAVGLYRAEAQQLFCPCHQSTFDVLRGGTVVFGPAARALPQLPLAVDASGTLVAQDGYGEPVGPDYWDRG